MESGSGNVCSAKNAFIGAWTEVNEKPSMEHVAKIVGKLTTALLRTVCKIYADETRVYVREITGPTSTSDPLSLMPEERIGHWTIGVKIGFETIMLTSDRFLLDFLPHEKNKIEFNEDWVK